ncbi:60 kDa chaperonin 2 [Arthrobacter sp. Hiyo8]|nr:60 kDa chaperonin 2 [Arthrobacter sp. Hiyo8]
MSSTRAALEEGIVSGGGSALIHALKALDEDSAVKALEGDAAAAVGIVRRALTQPLRWIAQNAGFDGYVVVAKVAELEANHGFNAKSGVYEDLIAAGVIDPSRSPAPHSRTPHPSQPWFSPPRPLLSRSRPRKTSTQATATSPHRLPSLASLRPGSPGGVGPSV